jgi:holo-[acyl-carrier protein] synthase
MQVGIDIVENKRIKLKEKFIRHLLSIDELEIFHSLTNKKRQREFLAGRWAVKEAIFKAQVHHFPVSQINVVNDEKGRPYLKNEQLKQITISISHEKKYTVAMAINEEKQMDRKDK